ncbi:MAG TPA: potassium-transporting ATPase subunit C [Isosphaeraceae bacterium]|jgi:K+-transporting ATPase ATPase C chain
MLRETIDALRACLVTFVICVVAYPAVVYGVGHTLFPKQAEGSLIERDGKVIGSELIAQPFGSDKYFQPRPSAAGPNGYAADAASGSNLGTKNPALIDRITVDVAKQVIAHDGNADVKARLEKLDSLQSNLKAKNEINGKTPADIEAIAKLEEGVSAAKSDLKAALASVAKTAKELVPADLVTASGGGLDPHISPESADYQAARVASARGADVSKVRDLITRHTERSAETVGAPPRVNVLLLNLDLDKELPPKAGVSAPKAEATPAPSTPAPTASTTSLAPAPAPAAAGRAEGMPQPTDMLLALASRVDKLQERLDAPPPDTLAADLKGIKAQVARLADVPADSERITKRLTEVDGRLQAVGREADEARSLARAAGDAARVAALEIQIKSLRDEISRLRDATPRRVPAPARTATAADLAPAVKLLRDRQFAGASAAFRTLTASHPDDARVWYYAALANGYATGQWRGETEELVNKGVDRERAGNPTAAEIEAAFAEILPPGPGRDWLSFYRQWAAKP